jgi:peptidoglycan/LPS O-acetylase OafA/YrhL
MPLVGMHVALPVALIGTFVFLLAAAISRRSVFYRDLVGKEIAATRFHSVDGLRGYLALGVVFHHLTLNYEYYRMGEWGRAPSSLGAFLGKGSVALFFMITAFLFWNRAIDTEGRFQANVFYQARVRRILPMYLFVVLLLVVTAFAMTGLTLRVSLANLMRAVLAWIFFTFPGELAINGYEQTRLINTVFWSLVWEWKFYLILPFLALFSGPRSRWHMMAVAALLLLAFDITSFGWFFWGGALAAMLSRLETVKSVSRTWGASLVAIGFLAMAVVYVPYAQGLPTVVLLIFPFTIISGGSTLFGLLTFKPARFLGILSYSVYLLHNWVLFVVSIIVNKYTPISGLSELNYWYLGALITITTVILASVTYRFVESPYLSAKVRIKDASRRSAAHPSYESRQTREGA